MASKPKDKPKATPATTADQTTTAAQQTPPVYKAPAVKPKASLPTETFGEGKAKREIQVAKEPTDIRVAAPLYWGTAPGSETLYKRGDIVRGFIGPLPKGATVVSKKEAREDDDAED